MVDDDPANIHAIANCLKEECVIKVATSGIKCIQLASQDPIPDLILLDVVMPEMDGYRTLEILKSENETKDIPVIFVTANTDLLEEEKGLKAGAVDYITKPIRPFIVLARVNTHLTLKKQKDSLIELARQDPLTGLHNRLALKEAAQREIPRANRHSKSLSLLMIDVDYFKKINDLHGHDVGDQVLKEVSDALKSNFRREDLVVRFGGEEFVVLLPLCDTKQAKIKGEETLRVIEQSKLGNIKVTVSIGCATLKPDETFESLLKRADQSLYKAKERGRNRIELAI